jgi:hypothetical protein
VTSFLYPAARRTALRSYREAIKLQLAPGGMSDSELYDLVNMLVSLCSPEQGEAKKQLLDIAMDLEWEEPDADAFRGCLAPITLDSRLEGT